MISAWRLITQRFQHKAFSGEGAKLYGGRWNHKGIPLVYTAESQSLALLEMLAQDEPLRAHYVFIAVSIPSVIIEQLNLKGLPKAWRDHTELNTLRTLGSKWAQRKSSAVLAVPSVIIPAETNYLLNPLHPLFKQIKVGKSQAFSIDTRLITKH